MIFFTERLHIRNYKPEDAEACYENWGHDESSGRYICNYPVESLETMVIQRMDTAGWFVWMMVRQ